tara:strand:- start:594 stop:887 length:294 start_codon:yes stop_codon:yes gene_type:complete
VITVTHFRGQPIPHFVKSKHALVEYVLRKYRDGEPISNGEFIYDLNYSRFGTSIHNLRREGFDIETLPSKKQGLVFYYLVKAPDDTEERNQLRLVAT